MARTKKEQKEVVASYLIKVNQSEHQQLQAAAKYQHRSITSFILNSALEAAARERSKQIWAEDYFTQLELDEAAAEHEAVVRLLGQPQ